MRSRWRARIEAIRGGPPPGSWSEVKSFPASMRRLNVCRCGTAAGIADRLPRRTFGDGRRSHHQRTAERMRLAGELRGVSLRGARRLSSVVGPVRCLRLKQARIGRHWPERHDFRSEPHAESRRLHEHLGVAREVPRVNALMARRAPSKPVTEPFRCSKRRSCPKFGSRVVRNSRTQSRRSGCKSGCVVRTPTSARSSTDELHVLELGQPLHAYDLNKFGGIIVRYARAQETSDAGWSRR